MKEISHYQQALLDVTAQIAKEKDTDKYVPLNTKKESLKNNLEELDKSLKEIDYREANQKAGYVYIISNIGTFGKDVYKIGMTRRLNPQDRVDELGGASVPFRFDIHALIFSNDAPSLENSLHKSFQDKKVNLINNRKEFFKVTLDEIKEVVRNNYDETVEFTEIPEAQQYRETLKIRELKGFN